MALKAKNSQVQAANRQRRAATQARMQPFMDALRRSDMPAAFAAMDQIFDKDSRDDV